MGSTDFPDPSTALPRLAGARGPVQGHRGSRAEVVGMLAPSSVALGRSLTLSEPIFLLCKIWRRTWYPAYCGALRRKCEQSWYPALSQREGPELGLLGVWPSGHISTNEKTCTLPTEQKLLCAPRTWQVLTDPCEWSVIPFLRDFWTYILSKNQPIPGQGPRAATGAHGLIGHHFPSKECSAKMFLPKEESNFSPLGNIYPSV